MHLTKQQLRNQCDLILDVPYGSTIFQHDRPQYYNTGIYGWRAIENNFRQACKDLLKEWDKTVNIL